MRRFLLRTALTIGAGIAILFVLLYTTTLSSSFYQPSYEERSKVGEAWRTGGFTIAVVWPPHDDMSFLHGVTLALEQINSSKSPFAGKIRLRHYPEKVDSTGEAGAAIAHEVVRDGSVVAVLGHEVSASALPASLTYESHGILFLTPKSTDPRLTTHKFQYTFRLTPNDRHIASAMVEFAKKRGWKSIGIFYSRSPGGESLASRLIASAEDAGVATVFSRSYLAHDTDWERQDFRPMIAGIRQEQVDAVMIADQLPRGAKLVKDLARMGMDKPIIACDKFDSRALWEIARGAANDLYVASAVDPDAQTPEFLTFKERFHRRWGADPGYGASQGYEALMVLVDAGTESRTADPLIVAATLRAFKWEGLFGEFTFSNSGDVEGRHISIKRMENGKFVTVKF